jgi:hypothetical protein
MFKQENIKEQKTNQGLRIDIITLERILRSISNQNTMVRRYGL